MTVLIVIGIIGLSLGVVASCQLGSSYQIDECLQDKKDRKTRLLLIFAVIIGIICTPFLGKEELGSSYGMWLVISFVIFLFFYLYAASQKEG